MEGHRSEAKNVPWVGLCPKHVQPAWTSQKPLLPGVAFCSPGLKGVEVEPHRLWASCTWRSARSMSIVTQPVARRSPFSSRVVALMGVAENPNVRAALHRNVEGTDQLRFSIAQVSRQVGHPKRTAARARACCWLGTRVRNFFDLPRPLVRVRRCGIPSRRCQPETTPVPSQERARQGLAGRTRRQTRQTEALWWARLLPCCRKKGPGWPIRAATRTKIDSATGETNRWQNHVIRARVLSRLYAPEMDEGRVERVPDTDSATQAGP